jgi:hypothetical protein
VTLATEFQETFTIHGDMVQLFQKRPLKFKPKARASKSSKSHPTSNFKQDFRIEKIIGLIST